MGKVTGRPLILPIFLPMFSALLRAVDQGIERSLPRNFAAIFSDLETQMLDRAFAFLLLVAPSLGCGGGGERPAFSCGGTPEAQPSRRAFRFSDRSRAYRDHGRYFQEKAKADALTLTAQKLIAIDRVLRLE